MTDRWLYAWALGAVSFGGASLLVPLYIVELGASPVDLGLLASTAALIGAPGAIAATKTLVRRARLEDPSTLVADAAGVFAKAARGAEGAEGMTAFLEKRKPKWAV